jgi:hypothetical protein
MISGNDRPYTVTLNVQDLEYVDLYAVSQDRMTCVIPLEYGYTKATISSCMSVPQGVNSVVLRISSSYARLVERNITLTGRAQGNTQVTGKSIRLSLVILVAILRWLQVRKSL